MRRAVLHGLGQNANAIIVLRAANRFSEALSAAGHAKNQWPMNWMALSEFFTKG
jgi:hypothetical protein